MRLVRIALVAVVLALAACAPVSKSTSSSADSADPTALVGLWRVAAEGEGAATWIKFDASVTLWSDCGIALGDWRASGALFVTDMTGSLNPWCTEHFPAWLGDASSYRVFSNTHAQLLRADNTVSAELTVDGRPPTSEQYSDDLVAVPTLTPEVVARLAAPQPLPDGVPAARTVIGRWTPSDATAGRDPYVEFAADGSWTGSDGCNAAGGRFVLGDAGLLLATSGASTAMGCDNSDGPTWVAKAARAGLDGDALTLYDTEGKKLGSFEPAS